MGTDIHFYIEKRNKQSKWEHVDIPAKILPDDRFYYLFAVLAGVRNGFGFAGCKTHDPVVPYFECRGIPEDTSYKELNFEDDEERIYPWLGEHSFTYATYDEIEKIDWEIKQNGYGIISRTQYPVFLESKDKTGKASAPTSYCGWIVGEGIKVAPSEQEFLQDPSYTHVQVEFEEQPLKACYFRFFIESVLPRWIKDGLSFIREEEKKDIRILMGFDS